MSRVEQLRRFLAEVKVEAKKVTWPDRRETMQATIVVIGMVLFIALFLWGVDALLSWFVKKVV